MVSGIPITIGVMKPSRLLVRLVVVSGILSEGIGIVDCDSLISGGVSNEVPANEHPQELPIPEVTITTGTKGLKGRGIRGGG